MEEIRIKVENNSRKIAELETKFAVHQANFSNMEKKLDSANSKLDELIQTQHDKASQKIDAIINTAIVGIVGAIIGAIMSMIIK